MRCNHDYSISLKFMELLMYLQVFIYCTSGIKYMAMASEVWYKIDIFYYENLRS